MTTHQTCLLIKSGETIQKSGYYVYNGHVNPEEFKKCFISPKAIIGLFLSKGSMCPDLLSCDHQVEWRLDS